MQSASRLDYALIIHQLQKQAPHRSHLDKMTWKVKWSRATECFCRRPGIILILLPCFLIVTLYLVSEDDVEYDSFHYPPYRTYNVTEGPVDGYLVWNPKCHMLSKDPLDPSIVRFIKKEKFEACSTQTLFTDTKKNLNGSTILFIDPEIEATYQNLDCCWSPIIRPKFDKPEKKNFDSIITVKSCKKFERQVTIPQDVEILKVSCKVKAPGEKAKTIYENVHAILNPRKIQNRSDINTNITENFVRKLSVLVLGIDSISRLNFYRTMPRTAKYLQDAGWISLNGYNKMGDNTFPNLMAMLTGQNQQQAYARCTPTQIHKLDQCPFLWHNFHNAGYITAYGEDETILNTFNYLKVGFVQPPTDYYLRPYILASEKLLKPKFRFNLYYCTGPKMSFERIFEYAMEFARTFLGMPYFGFFWMNSMSHNNINSASIMDERIVEKFKYLKEGGVFNDTMVVFLSDHGMRWGDIRNTFVGWYEERLPFVYIWLPEWFRNENPEAYQALKINQQRLTSPFDLYETFREIVTAAGGEAEPSQGCPSCHSLFEAVPWERGCQDAGIAPHWCTCTAFKSIPVDDKIALGGIDKFLDHIENIVKNYKDKRNNRLCAKLKLKKLYRVDQIVDFDNDNSTSTGYFYMVQVTPGDGKFEVTIHYHGNNTYTISDDQVSRINPYASTAKCLDHGMKQYCFCMK